MQSKKLKDGKITIGGNEFDISKGISEIRVVPEEVVMLYNLEKYILNDAKKRKQKTIGIDRESFEDKKGKEIKLKFTTEALKEMEEHQRKLAKDWRLEE